MIRSLLTAIAVFSCICAKAQHYHYQFQLENILTTGDAKIATAYMTKIFDKQPRYDPATGLFSIWSETRILKTVFAEKSFVNGYKLGAFTVSEATGFYTDGKK
ncbi:MAG: hypothetical protein H7Y00_16500 [Fimbriimonadaceae bacterium]|nr:hypothetical protein [Chitinophagales bacterium]